jgi:spermidine synthase
MTSKTQRTRCWKRGTPAVPLATALALVLTAYSLSAAPTLVYETTSPYHHIRVIDEGGLRSLCFDDATESRISLQDPLKGHFEYTEYFHMAWLWNARITNVLMVGLGGGSAQRSFVRYHPGVMIETVEIDPMVVQVARDYFGFQESEAQRVRVEDGRVSLRRSTARRDLIILDAYVSGRYGSSIPQHLATKEFFELVREHLTTNGVVAYNVIGSMSGWHADIVGAIFRTLKTVFPQVYIFQARTSINLVLVATRSPLKIDVTTLRQRADFLARTGIIAIPGFRERLENFQYQEPASAGRSPVLTDDYAPVEGLSGAGGKPGS